MPKFNRRLFAEGATDRPRMRRPGRGWDLRRGNERGLNRRILNKEQQNVEAV